MNTAFGLPLGASSPQARALNELFGETLIVCGFIFALVAVLVAYAIFRFRAREGDAAPAQREGNRRIEIAWTVAPAVVLVGLFILTVRTMKDSDPPADREPDLVVVAHQWWWEVHYRSGAVTANEIHVPTGKPLVVAVESADVVHDFWVPELGRKMDAIPGRRRSIWLQADAPGTYVGTCAEYCGAQHAWMRLLVIADTPDDFAAWEKGILTPPAPPAAPASARGEKLFAQLTCVKCHAVGGGGPNAGPDLTHLAGRSTLGAGVMANTPKELARWLKDPQLVKEGSHMPNLHLTDGQVDDLVTYFGSLR